MARHEVLTPVPGTFYRRPDPDSDPFFTDGDTVSEGATIGLVEIMKNFQEVEAEVAGRWSSSSWRTRTPSTPARPSPSSTTAS